MIGIAVKIENSPVKSLFVGTKVQGVKSIVSGEAAVKVGRGSATGLPERAGSSIDCHRAASLHVK
jgi:hypothetical protein